MAIELRRYALGNGLTVAADVGGDPSAPSIILLHGIGQTRHAWRHAFKQLLSGGYHVINFDARGHGDSDWAPDGNYTLDAFASDLRQVASTLQRPPALVGASMGGATALIAATDPPELMAPFVVLVDVVPRVSMKSAERIHGFMRRSRTGFATLEEALEYVAAYNPHRARPVDGSGLLRNLRLNADGRYYWHWDPAVIGDGWRSPRQRSTERLLAAAARIRVPSLLVRGLQSEIVSERGIAEFRRCLPGLEVCDVAGAGHMVSGDKNDAFNRCVIDFLRRHLPAN
jgi:pimeloyl-ACP methyl ester carboxylesterase